jgi:DNA-binding LacI/PurR family transcriptional regulator
LGRIAVKRVHALINGDDTAGVEIRIDAELVTRDSSGKCRRDAE